jgi:PadR family transcriptional regulator, regulatory protein PadR
MHPEQLKGHLDGLILAVLAGGPLHGYAVIEALKEKSDGVLELPEGTVYPALHRLERDGLLSSDWSAETGRRRRVYQLTHRGKRGLTERRAGWRAFSTTIDAVLAV